MKHQGSILLFTLSLLFFGTTLASADPQPETELIVLLRDDPAGQLTARSSRLALDRGLSKASLETEPLDVRFMIQQRTGGVARQRLVEEPNSPAARLERYLVLRYPVVADLEAIASDLRASPEVLYVGPNRRASLSAVIPNDPLFPLGPPPGQHQWGSHLLNLPEAWEHTTGHGYVAIIDTGIDVTHPDLGMTFDASSFIGGNYRPQLSFDWGYDDANPDEGQAQVQSGALRQVDKAGHGSHVAGIVAATANNGAGVAGVCWDCSLSVQKITHLVQNSGAWVNQGITDANWCEGWKAAVDRGNQVLNMSLGIRPPGDPDCNATPLDPLCTALALAEDRDVLQVAAAGNDGSSAPDWPAHEPTVFGAAGLQSDGQFWNDCPGGFECGSNFDPTMFDTPAKEVLSSFYRGLEYVPSLGCDDSLLPGFPGWGPCTGTSMASPYLAASVALVRSVNPLLERPSIETLLLDNLDNPPGWNPAEGHGKPDVNAAVEGALGPVAGGLLPNRLTPLFNFYSSQAETHLSTAVPQQATAAIFDSEVEFISHLQGDSVPGYGGFPGEPACTIRPCLYKPKAWAYVFTTPEQPFVGAPPLVPLYRLSFDQSFGGNPLNRSFAYTTVKVGVKRFTDAGYQLDGIEGYIMMRDEGCTVPSCTPAGATRLYRLYHFGRDDYAIFPESKLAQFQADGYVGQPNLNDWIGYVYENIDSDGDDLIDGFEAVAGTNPANADSDGDGITDGVEVLAFPYSDPLDQPTCNSVFADSFDGGSTLQWAQTIQGGQGQVGVNTSARLVGPFGMFAKIAAAGDSAWVRDNSPASETSYRASFYFSRGDSKIQSGNQHNILVLRDDSPNAWVVLVALRKTGNDYQVRARTRLDSGTVVNTAWVTFETSFQKPNVHVAEVAYQASTGPIANGSLTFTIDGTMLALTALDNDTRQIDHARFGMVSGIDAGTEGLFYFDEFVSCLD